MGEELNKDDCTIGMSADGDVCIMTMPLKLYAMDERNGSALIYGKFREMQAHAMQIATAMRVKKAQVGLIRANGAPPPDLKVN